MGWGLSTTTDPDLLGVLQRLPLSTLLLEPDALEAGRNPESITNGAGLSLGTGNLKWNEGD